MMEEKETEKEEDMSLWEVVMDPALRPSLVICVVMHLSQQLSGMVAIFQYAVVFFKEAGVDEDKAGYANVGVGVVMVLMTFVSVFLMDRLGRRPLHLTGRTVWVIFSSCKSLIVSQVFAVCPLSPSPWSSCRIIIKASSSSS